MRTPTDAGHHQPPRVGLRALALLISLVGGLMVTTPALALTVFACEPEWAALTRLLVPQARIHVATHAGQDPHHIEARPALIAQLRSADLAVCTGAGLESGWLPVLRQRAGKGRDEDVLFAADHAELIDPQPGAIGSPWAGDVHAEGNPHLHVDPRNLIDVAQALSDRFKRLLPDQQTAIEQRRLQWESRLKTQMTAWDRRAAPLRGKTVVAQHSSFGYLWSWLGLTPIADLEPRPGMAPTPGHLQRLVEGLRRQPPMAVVVASYQDPRSGRWLSAQLGPAVPLLVLPSTVAEDADGEGLIRWLDGLVNSLLQVAVR